MQFVLATREWNNLRNHSANDGLSTMQLSGINRQDPLINSYSPNMLHTQTHTNTHTSSNLVVAPTFYTSSRWEKNVFYFTVKAMFQPHTASIDWLFANFPQLLLLHLLSFPFQHGTVYSDNSWYSWYNVKAKKVPSTQSGISHQLMWRTWK